MSTPGNDETPDLSDDGIAATVTVSITSGDAKRVTLEVLAPDTGALATGVRGLLQVAVDKVAHDGDAAFTVEG